MSDLRARLLDRDATLWPPGNVSSNRLGWIGIAERMADEAAELTAWAATIDAERVVLLGMGGSSLGPEVLRASVGSDRLVVLDTTDPRTVAEVDLDGAFVLVSSKSGTTLEVEALLAHCWERIPDGRRFAAITDPGTKLASLATERGFARTFENPPDIGGRYSVLSYFGLVPAALLGYDVRALCEAAAATNLDEAVDLGRRVGEAALDGRDKLTVISPPAFASFGLWVEQLVAESTGKRGRGIVPVPTTEREEGEDRYLVEIEVADAADLAREFYRWEVATAVAGHVLDVDPFDEPNVAESKRNTAEVLAHLPLPDEPAEDPASVTEWVRSQLRPGDYVSIQAYLPYAEVDGLETLRRTLRGRLDTAPVTAGFGPRFLHSTGQLHKGGPDTVVAVQIVPNRATANLAVPHNGYDFATLIAAQALGDLKSLRGHDRRVLRVGADHLQEVG